jgi:hypothetical protein
LLLSLIFVQCDKDLISSKPNSKSSTQISRTGDTYTFGGSTSKFQQRRVEEVEEIAESFGFPDYMKIYYGKVPKFLLTSDRKELEKHFTRDSDLIQKSLDQVKFVETGDRILSLTDFFNAVGSYPSYAISEFHGLDSLNDYKNKYINSNCRFFINRSAVERLDQPGSFYPSFPFLIVLNQGEELPPFQVKEIDRK